MPKAMRHLGQSNHEAGGFAVDLPQSAFALVSSVFRNWHIQESLWNKWNAQHRTSQPVSLSEESRIVLERLRASAGYPQPLSALFIGLNRSFESAITVWEEIKEANIRLSGTRDTWMLP